MSGHTVYQDPSGDKIVGMSNPLPVQIISGGSGGSGSNKEFRVVEYRAKNAGTGYSVGDLILRTDVYNITTTTAVFESLNWFNATTNLAISSPTITDLDYVLQNNYATETTLSAMSVKIPSKGQTTMSGSTPVTLASDQTNINTNVVGSSLSLITTLQNAAVTTGVGTILSTNGYGVASIAISGTFVGAIAFEGQGADGLWYPINGRLRGGGSATSTVNVGGLYELNCMGLTSVRANITAYTSGSITVKGQAQALTPISDSVQIVGSGSIKGAIQNVTTVGARVQLPSYACREVTLIAKKTNTGTIYVGGNDVSSTVYGVLLDVKDSFTFTISNTNLIWIDASVSGEGVSYVAI